MSAAPLRHLSAAPSISLPARVEVSEHPYWYGAILPEVLLADDGAQLSGAVLSLIAGRLPIDHLATAAMPAGIKAAVDQDAGVVRLSGLGSLADYQAALRRILFQSDDERAAPPPRLFSLVVTDTDGETSAPAMTELYVIPVDDPPSLTFGTTHILEDTTGYLTMLRVTDPDAPPEALVILDFIASNLTFTTTPGAGVTVAKSGVGELALIGSQAALSAFFAEGHLGVRAPADAAGIYSVNWNLTGDTGSNWGLSVIFFDPVNDAPREIGVAGGGPLTIAEGAEGGAVLGAFATTDVDDTRFIYTLVDDASGRFRLDATGRLVVRDGLALDFESQSTHRIVLRSTDAGGLWLERDFTISLLDVAEERASGDSRPNLLRGGDGGDVLSGGYGADTLFGGRGADVLYGNQDEDVLYGNQDDDALYGGQGSDTLFGGQGDDSMFGNAGDDVLEGGVGTNRVEGGDGADTAAYAFALLGVTVSLALQSRMQATGVSTDLLIGIENLTGSTFADALTGDADANLLSGGDGDDALSGAEGDDVLVGGAGADRLDGGAGSDTFRYVSPSDSPIGSSDRIADFASGQDRIDLRLVHTGPTDVYSLTTIAGVTYLNVDFGDDGSVEMQILVAGPVSASDILWI